MQGVGKGNTGAAPTTRSGPHQTDQCFVSSAQPWNLLELFPTQKREVEWDPGLVLVARSWSWSRQTQATTPTRRLSERRPRINAKTRPGSMVLAPSSAPLSHGASPTRAATAIHGDLAPATRHQPRPTQTAVRVDKSLSAAIIHGTFQAIGRLTRGWPPSSAWGAQGLAPSPPRAASASPCSPSTTVYGLGLMVALARMLEHSKEKDWQVPLNTSRCMAPGGAAPSER